MEVGGEEEKNQAFLPFFFLSSSLSLSDLHILTFRGERFSFCFLRIPFPLLVSLSLTLAYKSASIRKGNGSLFSHVAITVFSLTSGLFHALLAPSFLDHLSRTQSLFLYIKGRKERAKKDGTSRRWTHRRRRKAGRKRKGMASGISLFCFLFPFMLLPHFDAFSPYCWTIQCTFVMSTLSQLGQTHTDTPTRYTVRYVQQEHLVCHGNVFSCPLVKTTPSYNARTNTQDCRK